MLQAWHVKEERYFRVELGNFARQDKAPPGMYPNWRQVVPLERALDCHLPILEPERVIDFLRVVPDHPPFHAVELLMTKREATFIPAVAPDMKLPVEAELLGTVPVKLFALNKHILLRMLQQGYKTFATGLVGSSLTREEIVGQFEEAFRIEVEATPNLIFKEGETVDTMIELAAKMLDVALASWSDFYTVKGAAQAFKIEVPGFIVNTKG